jgi:ABC-2 type transport system permease protein
VVVCAEHSNFTRAIINAMKNSEYFTIIKEAETEEEAEKILKGAKAQFVVTFPPDFSRELVKGRKPQLLIQADAADPAAVSYALLAFGEIVNSALARELKGFPLAIRGSSSPVDIRLHRCFNPEIKTQVYVVPGLLGVILMMTMVFITSLAITKEKERGTMETLLATPVKPLEVIIGKIVPYILIGYTQMSLVMLLARYLLDISCAGSVTLLYLIAFFFIAANLAIGVTISTLAKNQLQAVQISVFFFLPSILLSGFMFPFRGMPLWARCIGQTLPMTHFLEVARGIILRGAGFADLYGHCICIGIFLFAAILLSLAGYKRTLD